MLLMCYCSSVDAFSNVRLAIIALEVGFVFRNVWENMIIPCFLTSMLPPSYSKKLNWTRMQYWDTQKHELWCDRLYLTLKFPLKWWQWASFIKVDMKRFTWKWLVWRFKQEKSCKFNVLLCVCVNLSIRRLMTVNRNSTDVKLYNLHGHDVWNIAWSLNGLCLWHFQRLALIQSDF